MKQSLAWAGLIAEVPAGGDSRAIEELLHWL